MNHEVGAGQKKRVVQTVLSGLPTNLELVVMGGGWIVMHHINTSGGSHGGYNQTFEVQPNPDRMTSYGIPMDLLFQRLEANNCTSSGGYVIHHGEQRFIRGVSLLENEEDIKAVVIRREPDGNPILVRDIANVSIQPMAQNLGAEFMPRLEEGDILVEAQRLPSATLEGLIDISHVHVR